MIVSLISSLLTALKSELLRLFLLTSLRSEFLLTSLLASLRSKFLQSFLLASLWNIFLQRLYEDIPMVTPILSKTEMFVQGIHLKPEMLLQSIWEFMMLSKQVKPEVFKSWSSLHASLQSYAKFFYKYIRYYLIDQNTNNNKWSIRIITKKYTMFLKRKQNRKMKAKECAEGQYHQGLNNKLESSSHC